LTHPYPSSGNLCSPVTSKYFLYGSQGEATSAKTGTRQKFSPGASMVLGFIVAKRLHSNETSLLMAMRRITRTVSKLLLRERKCDFNYVSLRSEPCRAQTFPHSQSHDSSSCATPEGCFPVDVGKERKRYFVGISYLNHPLIRALLQRSEEEFGMDQSGVLTIPCDVESFEHVLWLVHNHPNPSSESIEEFVRYYVFISQSYVTEEPELQ